MEPTGGRGIPGSGPKPFCGLNAKARRVAGLHLLLYKLVITGESSFWFVENTVSG
jgi:hypothetical protein